ncbi:MAG: uridine kinase [Calothrix sp. MO_192.B10]|nr:uridine kinase [Calothrix sp. MO_192.B10]
MISKTVNDLVTTIQEGRSQVLPDKSLLVAISGIDGSGKGYVTEKIAKETNRQGLRTISINIDPWLNPPEQRFSAKNSGEHFYHHAFSFEDLFEQLIYPLQNQRAIYLKKTLTGQFGTPFEQIYDFQDVDVILLEGIFLLRRSLRYNYDLAFWIECSFETALERALQRNQENLPTQAIIDDYNTIYFPAQRFHFRVDQPKSSVDLIYINDWRA